MTEGDIMKRTILALAATTLLVLVAAVPAAAQSGHPGPAGWQRAMFQLRLGMFMPSGDSDFWDATGEVFTLDSSDFDDFILGFSYIHSVNNEVEIGVNVDFYEERVRAEYRDFVDSAGFPILHDTELELIPFTVDVRFLPGGRYRIRPGGRYVMKPVFYIGAGAGLNLWDYEEVGDFLDFGFDPPEIFGDRFIDDGVAFEVHALAGVEVPVGQSTNLLLETRYSVSDDDLGGDFAGLADTELDLGGSSFYGGLSFRF
jgi:hypothetical protein